MVASATPDGACAGMFEKKISKGDRWRYPLRAPPSLLSMLAFAIQSRAEHLGGLLGAAGIYSARIVLLSSLLSGSSGRGSLVSEGEA
ncbi:unnamed protein product [Sphagnum balticum]